MIEFVLEVLSPEVFENVVEVDREKGWLPAFCGAQGAIVGQDTGENVSQGLKTERCGQMFKFHKRVRLPKEHSAFWNTALESCCSQLGPPDFTPEHSVEFVNPVVAFLSLVFVVDA